MINKYAVEDYLKRAMRDLHQAKQWSRKRIDRKLATVMGFTPHTKPRHHQKVCLYLLLRYRYVAELLGMGLGKTYVALNAIRALRRQGKIKRAVVLVPNIANVEAWRIEVEKHAPQLKFIGVDGGSAERARAWADTKAHVFCCTYAALNAKLTKKVKVRGKNKKGRHKWIVDAKKVKAFAANCGALILDESTALKNHLSLTFNVTRQVSKQSYLRTAMTGTPHGRDPQDLWAQFYVVDRGDALGQSLGLFRSGFFHETQDYIKGTVYKFNKRRLKRLRQKMRHSSIRYEESECLDLPKLVPTIRRVTFPPEVYKQYDQILKELRKTERNFIEIKNAFVQMRQLTSGYMVVKSEKGEPVIVPFKNNPKLELLVEDLQAMPANRQAVVFHDYRPAGQLIFDRLTKEGFKPLWIHGKARNRRDILRAFTRHRRNRVLICSSAGAQGLNLQNANYVMFYQSPVSPIIRAQEEKRCHRHGQTRTVFMYDYAVRDSVEEKILEYIGEGKNLLKSIVSGDNWQMLERSKPRRRIDK